MISDKDRSVNLVAITRSKQDWTPGNVVKVGFLSLRVLSVVAVKDWLPDIYTLESLDGTKKYEFIPHNGLSRVYGDMIIVT